MTATSSTLSGSLLSDAVVVILIALLAVVLAFVRSTTIPKPTADDGTITKINLQEAQMQMAAGAMFIDARPAPFYEFGHIPSAISVPKTSFEKSWEEFAPKPELNASIVVYCSGENCEDSLDVAMELRAKGFSQVVVFEGGFEAWEAAGLPAKEGQQ